MNKAAIDATPESRQDDWTGVNEMQREMLGFMAARLQKDSDALKEMVAHPDLNHAFGVQSRWLAETVHDYLVESEKMVAMITRPASSFMLAETGDKDALEKARESAA